MLDYCFVSYFDQVWCHHGEATHFRAWWNRRIFIKFIVAPPLAISSTSLQMYMIECLRTRYKFKVQKSGIVFKSSSKDKPYKSRSSKLGQEWRTSGMEVTHIVAIITGIFLPIYMKVCMQKQTNSTSSVPSTLKFCP